MSWSRFFHRKGSDAELQQEIDTYMTEEVAESLARGRPCLLSQPCKGTARIRSDRHGKGPEKVCWLCDGTGKF